jgi:replicative DNA helicase
MRAGGKRFRDDRVQELSEISGDIQSLGKELQIPFVVLAQMNRDYEKDPNRAPRLSDLKDCGSIEQDADLVGFLYKPKMREKEEEQYSAAMEAIYGDDWSTYPVRQNLFFAKNRYGPTGIAQLLFQKSCTRFLDWVVWLKEHGQKTAALGERQYKDKGALPTNEELEI